MGEQKRKKNISVGLLAHVDAGKTTFSEQVLEKAHVLRAAGRVDHGNTFLDTDPMEKARGITIFSGQAVFRLGDETVCWLDTPGHMDFSTEMERALSVMDAAVLVISCAEGIQSHTETVWELLKRYRVPVMIFLNKTDRQGADPDGVLRDIRRRLSSDALDLRQYQSFQDFGDAAEEIAAHDEALMESYCEGACTADMLLSALASLTANRTIFPVMAGSALECTGIDGFLSVLSGMLPAFRPAPQPVFGARCYQVRRDEKGNRLCFLKITGGTLGVKDTLGSSKVNEIRIYSGEKYRTTDQVSSGELCAVTGLAETRIGDTFGAAEAVPFCTEPMLMSEVIWDRNTVPAVKMLQALRQFEEEEPSLAVQENGSLLQVQVMGSMQLDVLRNRMQDRFGWQISFGPRKVLYRETVAAPVIGIGHYEPLRHYAEVHLRISPAAPGSGIAFGSLCHVDDLTLNWQRLIETHVFEKQHRGVLIGAPLTDVKIDLLTGRAHLKHTEGGDFRQAVYRAIRHGLMQAQNVLLEPICAFTLTFPAEHYGAVSSSLAALKAALLPPEYEGDNIRLAGEMPYSLYVPWQEGYLPMTRGRGTERIRMSRYAPAHDQQEVTAAADYNPLADDTPDSVFCSHGAGFTVPWEQVADYAHLHWEG